MVFCQTIPLSLFAMTVLVICMGDRLSKYIGESGDIKVASKINNITGYPASPPR